MKCKVERGGCGGWSRGKSNVARVNMRAVVQQ